MNGSPACFVAVNPILNPRLVVAEPAIQIIGLPRYRLLSCPLLRVVCGVNPFGLPNPAMSKFQVAFLLPLELTWNSGCADFVVALTKGGCLPMVSRFHRERPCSSVNRNEEAKILSFPLGMQVV